jgi:hypothetical protein
VQRFEARNAVMAGTLTATVVQDAVEQGRPWSLSTKFWRRDHLIFRATNGKMGARSDSLQRVLKWLSLQRFAQVSVKAL